MKSILAWFNSLLKKRGKFFRDIVTIMTGTVISRIIALAALPILSRIYTPAEFGVLALFTLVIVTVGCVASGRYDVAIVLPKEDRDATYLLVSAIIIITISSLVSGMVLWVWRGDIADLLGAEELKFWLLVSPGVIWALAVSNALQFWVTRKKQFGYISASEIGGTTVNVSTQILLNIIFKVGAAGLIIGQIIYQFSTLIIFGRGTSRTLKAENLRNFDPRHALQLLARYKNFPIYDAWANLLNVASREFPILFLGIFFSSGIVGLYSVGYRIMSMPVTVIGRAVTRVFLTEAKAGHDAGQLDRMALNLCTQLFALSLTPALMIAVAAPEIIGIILGSAWLESGVYIQWLSVYLAMTFVAMPLIQMLFVLEKQRQRLIYQTVLAVGRIMGLVIGGLLGDPVLAIALASSIGVVVIFITIIIVMGYAGVKYTLVFRVLFMELVKAVPFVLVLLFAKLWSVDDLTVMLAFIVVGLLFTVVRFKQIIGIQPA